MKTSADFQRMVERHGRSRIGGIHGLCDEGEKFWAGHRRHRVHQHRPYEPAVGDRIPLDRAFLAANGGEHRGEIGEISDAAACIRSLEMLRVELKTDALNEGSRNAILRLGAKGEGILRQPLVTSTGRIRDTVYFIILDGEWPEIKQRLESKLGRS
jgi:hypothetical protein